MFWSNAGILSYAKRLRTHSDTSRDTATSVLVSHWSIELNWDWQVTFECHDEHTFIMDYEDCY